MRSEKVILFPKWKTALEEESLQALKDKKYELALSKLNELISFQIKNHEIMIGKLMCLMELGRYDEAKQVCEEVINYQDENYYQYVHIYLTILFQTSQYDVLMEQVSYELEDENIPPIMREQFKQLYDLSEKLLEEVNLEKSTAYIDELVTAIEEKNYQKQWHFVAKMKKTRTTPSNDVIELLANKSVHPVLKTAIFIWLQDENYRQSVRINKLGMHLSIKPTEITDYQSHRIVERIKLLIREIEYENPSLYHLLEMQLLHYTYVRFPIMPDEAHVTHIAEALKIIGGQYLNLETKEQAQPSSLTQQYIEEITLCEKLYASMVEA